MKADYSGIPLMEVEEIDIEEKPKNQWAMQLEKEVNKNGIEKSFDKSVEIKYKPDIWNNRP